MNEWYKKEVKEVAVFFDVDIDNGLTSDSVLARVKRFGDNDDPYLAEDAKALFKSKVKRQGRTETINSKNLVPGDVVILEEGNRVPADIRLFQVKALRIDQGRLTGESQPAIKNTYASKETDLAGQKCIAFAGTFVTNGSGIGIVTNLANKSVQRNIKKTSFKKARLANSLKFRKLKKAGVVINHPNNAWKIKNVDIVFIDMNLTEQEIQDLIAKIQLAKKLACKFIVIKELAQRMKRDLVGAIIYDGQEIAGHVTKQLINTVNDAQFITDANDEDLIKLLSALNTHDIKTILISDGTRTPNVLSAAYLSIIIGSFGRDDSIDRADLILPKSKPQILERILYNK